MRACDVAGIAGNLRMPSGLLVNECLATFRFQLGALEGDTVEATVASDSADPGGNQLEVIYTTVSGVASVISVLAQCR